MAGKASRGRGHRRGKAIAAALDLGSTMIKGALLEESGSLRGIVARPAPPLDGTGLIRESDPSAWMHEVVAVLAEVRRAAGSCLPLAIASQRSSFVLWERRQAIAVTPLISWQDRRAESWCARHAGDGEMIGRVTGVRLSPHYAGPKLASLLEGDATLAEMMAGGEIRFGTLDAFLLAHLTGERCHETDLTMAARTLLADPRSGGWSADLLGWAGVPAASLPEIVASTRREGPEIEGLPVTAGLADQSAAALAALGAASDDALVSLGTGGFVMRATGGEMRRPEGYLSGVLLGDPGRKTRFAAEGTINGVSEALYRFGSGPTPLPAEDPSPRAFCLPDVTGTGAPHWKAGATLELSKEASALSPHERRRIVIEGVIFRVREILEDLFGADEPRRVLLSGGPATEATIAEGLAACLGRSVHRLTDPEATLLGAARLAAGMEPGAPPPAAIEVPHGKAGHYLRGKFAPWRGWLRSLD
jgi:glycerol kinase